MQDPEDIQRVAVITGANRGLGFETARQLGRLGYRVVVTSRDGLLGKAAADKLQSESLETGYQPLDVTRDESIIRLREFLENAFGRLDVLINNAGIFPERSREDARGLTIMDVDGDTLRASLEVNTLGPLRVTQELLPLMRRHGYGRVVNVSSGYGRLAGMAADYPAYRLSKSALHAVTRMFAAETSGEDILVNAVDPGWAQTRMGGSQAKYTPPEAAKWIVDAALLPPDGPRGRLLHQGRPVDW
jgi:NAD(P)-dependent dehydrogenase (short-subunit alcohol dehydrogenase family)